MKNNLYLRLIGATAVIVLVHVVIAKLFFQISNVNIIYALDAFLIFLFLASGLIIKSKKRDNPEGFVGRFMILTTIQLLSAMSVLAALSFVNIVNLRFVSLNFIGVFIAVLTAQSLLLIRGVKKQS